MLTYCYFCSYNPPTLHLQPHVLHPHATVIKPISIGKYHAAAEAGRGPVRCSWWLVSGSCYKASAAHNCSNYFNCGSTPRVASQHTPPAWHFQSAIGKTCTTERRALALHAILLHRQCAQRRPKRLKSHTGLTSAKHRSPTPAAIASALSCTCYTYVVANHAKITTHKGIKVAPLLCVPPTCRHCALNASEQSPCYHYMRPRHVGTAHLSIPPQRLCICRDATCAQKSAHTCNC